MRALIIHPGERSLSPCEIDARDEAKSLRSLIGHWFTTCFTIRLPKHEVLVGYCDEEFLVPDASPNEGKWCCAIGPSLRRDSPYPIGGPVVITASDHAGNGRPLADSEASLFVISRIVTLRGPGGQITLPVLDYLASAIPAPRKESRR